MRVLGMISGTSHDGIDVAVVDLRPDGDVLRASIAHTDSTPYAPELRTRIAAALPPAPTTLAEVCELDTLIGRAFADAAAAAIARVGAVDLVCSHGQTVFHWVEGARALGTLQLGQPAWIAEAAGAPVVSDARARDIAAGGQGAPLVSLLDVLVLGRFPGRSAALNLGGISNATIVDPEREPVAFDIGPANALIDAAVVAAGADPDGFDRGGRLAAAGRVDAALLEVLLAEPYYALPVPRSTGKELFTPSYVPDAVARSGSAPSTEDLVATLTELTVRTVVAELTRAEVATVVVSGGGWRNPVLMDGIRRGLPAARVVPSDDLGLPTDAKEAVAFALIGWLTAHGLPGTVPSCTGADRAVVLGSVTPGPDGTLPHPERRTAPTSLEVESA